MWRHLYRYGFIALFFWLNFYTLFDDISQLSKGDLFTYIILAMQLCYFTIFMLYCHAIARNFNQTTKMVKLERALHLSMTVLAITTLVIYYGNSWIWSEGTTNSARILELWKVTTLGASVIVSDMLYFWELRQPKIVERDYWNTPHTHDNFFIVFACIVVFLTALVTTKIIMGSPREYLRILYYACFLVIMLTAQSQLQCLKQQRFFFYGLLLGSILLNLGVAVEFIVFIAPSLLLKIQEFDVSNFGVVAATVCFLAQFGTLTAWFAWGIFCEKRAVTGH